MDGQARADPLEECGFRSTASTILNENGFKGNQSGVTDLRTSAVNLSKLRKVSQILFRISPLSTR